MGPHGCVILTFECIIVSYCVVHATLCLICFRCFHFWKVTIVHYVHYTVVYSHEVTVH